MKNGQKNGHRNGQHNGKVRVAIVGVGNCASSFVQGVHYYRDASEKTFVPGLMHVNLGGYHIKDIEFVAAFDVDKKKVGLDLSDAIFAGANNTVKFTDVPKTGVKVQRGMTHDGIGKYLADIVIKAPGETSDVVGILRKTKADVLVSYLPVGSEEATKWYGEQALQAGVGFVNCIPVFIAREPYWQKRFEEKDVPIIGDGPLNVELKLEVHDSPNSAGIVIDAVRCIKPALDRGIGGALEAPSSYFMKSPPVQYSDSEAKSLVEEFIGAGKATSNGRSRRIGRTKPATAAARR